jgi:hypothetical protein
MAFAVMRNRVFFADLLRSQCLVSRANILAVHDTPSFVRTVCASTPAVFFWVIEIVISAEVTEDD